MIGVLLFSRSPRKSSWAAVRGSKEIRVTGLNGSDEVVLSLKARHGVDSLILTSDTNITVSDDIISVMAEHIEASGSDVCVEMH